MANDIIGVKEVQKLLENVGKAPAKVLTKATKAATKIVRNAARSNAPEDSGVLKSDIIMKAEKSKKGKKVYQVFVRSDERLVKISKAGKRSFYPASQEYGWTDQYGNYHPGYRFMRKAADENMGAVRSMMLDVMGKELDKLR